MREAAGIRPGDRVVVRARPEGGVLAEVDTNILIDIASGDLKWAERSIDALSAAAGRFLHRRSRERARVPLLTRDTGRYSAYFPELELIAPAT